MEPLPKSFGTVALEKRVRINPDFCNHFRVHFRYKLSAVCIASFKNRKAPESTEHLPCAFGVRLSYRTTIAVLDGSPSKALLTTITRYSSSFPAGCSTRVASVMKAVTTSCQGPLWGVSSNCRYLCLAFSLKRLLLGFKRKGRGIFCFVW
jgi:hypothetical protein